MNAGCRREEPSQGVGFLDRIYGGLNEAQETCHLKDWEEMHANDKQNDGKGGDELPRKRVHGEASRPKLQQQATKQRPASRIAVM